jgi:hypothetical protein
MIIGTCGASGRSLVDSFRQALDDNTVKIKSYNDRIDLDSEGHASYPCPMTLTLYSPFIFFMFPSVTTSASFTLLMTTISWC